MAPNLSSAGELLPTPASPTSRRLSERDAAVYIRMSPSFLAHDRIGQRRIPFVKIGAAVRYCTGDLDRFLAACKRDAEGGCNA